MIVTFDSDGTVTALHRDSFDLSFLGKQSIQRATDIRFNEDTQLWDMHVRDGDGFACIHDEQMGFPTYEAARKVEVEWLDHCLLREFSPLGFSAAVALGRIRLNRGV